jgi:hypothetical protein
VTAMAQAGPAQVAVGQSGTREGGTGEGASGSVLPGNALGSGVVAKVVVQALAPEPPRRFPAHTLWAVLITRIYEVFPLVCPLCGGNMRILAFITEGHRSGGSWSTSAWTLRRRPSPRHAGRRFGTRVTHGVQMVPGRGPQSTRTGASQPRQHPRTRPINAPIGAWTDRPATRTRRGAGRAGGGARRMRVLRVAAGTISGLGWLDFPTSAIQVMAEDVASIVVRTPARCLQVVAIVTSSKLVMA